VFAVSDTEPLKGSCTQALDVRRLAEFDAFLSRILIRDLKKIDSEFTATITRVQTVTLVESGARNPGRRHPGATDSRTVERLWGVIHRKEREPVSLESTTMDLTDLLMAHG
jgi:hypothetical protein